MVVSSVLTFLRERTPKGVLFFCLRFKGAVRMRFTKETARRALRTLIQSALAYIAVNIAVIDFTEKDAAKSALIGLVVSAVAAGIAAVMNLEKTEDEDDGDA